MGGHAGNQVTSVAAPDLLSLRGWVGRDYWPNPAGLVPEPVRAVDIDRYASALDDWHRGREGNVAPPGFMEVASPNYLNYLRMSGEEFLRNLLPFDSPWGPGWTPMMLIRSELWEVERPVAVGDVIRGTSTITDITWQEARGTRPSLLGVEFTKVYGDAVDDPLGRVVWDMVFVGHALVDERPSDAEVMPAPADDLVRRAGRMPRAEDPIGRYTRVFDMEALVRWSAAIWDLGLPHIDPDYARRVYGLPHAVVHGPLINASLARLVTDWMDPGDRVVTHHGRFRRPVAGNDRLTFSAVIADVDTSASTPVAVARGLASNQYGVIVAESETRCSLAAG